MTELPSRFTAQPEQVDAYLREILADDTRLAFYRWLGTIAVGEAVTDARLAAERSLDKNEERNLAEYFDEIDPAHGPVAYPSRPPLGIPWCDLPHHTHLYGDERSPTCRLDSEDGDPIFADGILMIEIDQLLRENGFRPCRWQEQGLNNTVITRAGYMLAKANERAVAVTFFSCSAEVGTPPATMKRVHLISQMRTLLAGRGYPVLTTPVGQPAILVKEK